MIARYTLIFTGLFLAFSALIMVVFYVLDLEGNSGLSVVMTMVAAMMIGQMFVKDQNRALTKKERHQLAATFTLAATVISTLLAVAVFALLAGPEGAAYYAGILADMAIFMVAVTLVVMLIQYGVIWLGLGIGVKAALKQQAAKAEKAAKE